MLNLAQRRREDWLRGWLLESSSTAVAVLVQRGAFHPVCRVLALAVCCRAICGSTITRPTCAGTHLHSFQPSDLTVCICMPGLCSERSPQHTADSYFCPARCSPPSALGPWSGRLLLHRLMLHIHMPYLVHTCTTASCLLAEDDKCQCVESCSCHLLRRNCTPDLWCGTPAWQLAVCYTCERLVMTQCPWLPV